MYHPFSRSRSSASRRRAAIAILTGLGLFLGSQFVLGRLFTGPWHVVRDPVYTTHLERLRAKQVAAGEPSRTVLFLGTSRFEFGIRTGILEPQLSSDLGSPVLVGNWGRGGWGLFRALLCSRRIQRDQLRPDLVVIEILPIQLTRGHPLDMEAAWLPSNQLLDTSEGDLLLRHQPARQDVRRDRRLAWLAPLHTHRLEIVRLLQPSLLPEAGRPYALLGTDFLLTWPDETRSAMREVMRNAYGPSLARFRLGGAGPAVLEETLANLRQAGIPTAVMLMPEGPVFRSWYPRATWEQIQGYLTDLSRRTGVPVVDTRSWIDDEAAFNDSHHLTAAGAESFSRRLGRQVLLPLLRRDHAIASQIRP